MNKAQDNLTSLLVKVSNLIDRGQSNEAEPDCQKLFDMAPDNVDVLLQCGRLRYGQGKLETATALLEKGFELAPDHEGTRTMLFASYKDNRNFDQMIKIANLFSESPLSDNELALAYTAYLRICDWNSAHKIEQQVLVLARDGKIEAGLLPAILLTINGIPNSSPELAYQLHRQWSKMYSKGIKAKLPKKINGRIRIAYVSGDYFRHPVGYFMHQIVASHNRDEFEVFCYAQLRGRHDDVTELFERDADHFIDITDMDDATMVARMKKDGIHIAVDLNSHTAHTRTPAFAQRLAPIQISYLGYPNTTGLTEMDYHITDHFAQDLEHGTKYTEELLFAPECFLCYAMEWDQPKKATAPCEESGSVTFGSFNDSRKLNLEVVKTWSTILQRVQNSRLLLKFVGSEEPMICNNIKQAFSDHGIDEGRVQFLQRTPVPGEHILAYHDVDISLDPFPYTGTTTTCESLSQGVPVITLVGPKHSNRVSYSILKNIGFEETIAHSTDEYIEKAVNLANNPGGLSVLRGCLPLLLEHSPLKKTEQFVHNLEALYKQACEKKGIHLNLHAGAAMQSKSHEEPAAAKSISRKLHIGGKEKHPDWEILDANQSDLTDHVGNANNLSIFENNTFDAIYSSHVLEHFSYQNELSHVLSEWHRVLKPGGIMYASVPNLEVLCELFLMKDQLSSQDRFNVMRMMYGGQIDPYDFHKVGYNAEILGSFFNHAGFENIRIVEAFDIFNDTSKMEFGGRCISLNMIAEKTDAR